MIHILTIFIMALALSIDAFAISVARSICHDKRYEHDWLLTPLFFGVAQGVMPIIGYIGADKLAGPLISSAGGYLAALILGTIGIKLILDAGKEKTEVECEVKKGYFMPLFMQAIATSIDALAVGIGMFATGEPIYSSALIIAVVTFGMCIFAFRAGQQTFKNTDSRKAQYAAGAILMVLAIKAAIG